MTGMRRGLLDALQVVAGKVTVIAALFLSGVVIARVLGPDQYGLYAAVLGIILLADGALGAPLDLASVRFASAHGGPEGSEAPRVARFLSAVFRIKLLIAGSAALVALVFAPLWPKVGIGPAVALAGAVSLGGVLLLRSTATYLQTAFAFGRYALLDLLQAVLRLGVVLLLAAWLPEAGLVAFLLAYGGTSLLIFLAALQRVRQPYLRAGWPSSDDARAILGYAGLTSVVVGLGTLTGRLDVVLLAARAEPALGDYAVAAQLAGLATLLASYLSVVVQPRVVPAWRDRSLGRLLTISFVVAALLALVAAPLVWHLAEPFVVLVFGEAYRGAAPLLLVLLVGTWIDLLSMPVLIPFALQLQLRRALALEIGATALFLVLAPLAAGQSAEAMAWTMTCVRAVKLLGYLGIFVASVRRPPADI